MKKLKVVKKKIIKKPKMKVVNAVKTSIFGQLTILTPEEIKFLMESMVYTVDATVKILNEQQIVLTEMETTLKRIDSKEYSMMQYPEYRENLIKSIQNYQDCIKVNIVKVKNVKSISTKLKCFEGIV